MRLKNTILSFALTLTLGLSVGALLPTRAMAQAAQALPIDSAVRTGKLPNGLTYFIRHNEEPKGRAEFYIAQKVGSMQEEDSQQGLAHFLEHIAFNGTKNFPGKGLINFLESIGASFGGNINAYTAFDQTVYTLMKIPVSRNSIVDSCILILHDWSNSISLEDKEIDAERGVIEEEWRSRNGGDFRAMEKQLALAFPNNKYGQRMPIGKMEIVRSFPYQVLRDYYKKWYRPDLQGIIIVGDVDVNYVEGQIKKIFADIPAPVNPAERVYVPVEDNDKPIVGIAVDKEATNNSLSIYYKSDVMPREMKASIFGPMSDYLRSIITAMVDQRFSDITKKPNAPFNYAGMGIGEFLVATTKDAVTFTAGYKIGEWEAALKGLTAEIARLHQYGFTAGEYERAKKDYLVQLKNLYTERDKQTSAKLANEYVEYFLNGGYLLSIPTYYELMQSIVPQIPLQVINENIKEMFDPNKNAVVILSGADRPEAKLPTEADLTAKFEAGLKQPVTALKDEVSNEKLIDKLPQKGKIVSEKKDAKFGATQWTLSNGVKVTFKKTDFKEDEILLSAQRDGGYHNLQGIKPTEIKALNSIGAIGGLGKFNESALEKALSGHLASASTSISDIAELVSGNTTKDDLETLLQLVYLRFTGLRLDKEAFATWQQQTISQIESSASNPLMTFVKELQEYLYPKNPEKKQLTVEEVKALSYDRVLSFFRSRFANARGFNFYLVGNIDEAKLRPLVEQYLGALPASKQPTGKAYTERVPMTIAGTNQREFSQPMETPMGIAIDGLRTKGVYDLKSIITANVLNSVLDQLYVKTIREDEGGTYGVSVDVSINRYPQPTRELGVQFQTEPTKVAKLNDLVFKGLEGIVKEGPSQEYFDKAVANLTKEHTEKLRRNAYWLGQLNNYFSKNLDFVSTYEAVLKSVTKAEVQEFARSLYDSKDRTVVLFRTTTPEKK